MEITKQGAQSLRMKMHNTELYLKWATVIYDFQPMQQEHVPKLSSVKVGRLDSSRWFHTEYVQERTSHGKLSTDQSSDERWYEILVIHFAEMTGDRLQANERYYTACKCCQSIFTKI